jgi:hypothetical protein
MSEFSRDQIETVIGYLSRRTASRQEFLAASMIKQALENVDALKNTAPQPSGQDVIGWVGTSANYIRDLEHLISHPYTNSICSVWWQKHEPKVDGYRFWPIYAASSPAAVSKPVYKDGTTPTDIVKDGWARGFHIEQTVEELIAQGFECTKGRVSLLAQCFIESLRELWEAQLRRDIGTERAVESGGDEWLLSEALATIENDYIEGDLSGLSEGGKERRMLCVEALENRLKRGKRAVESGGGGYRLLCVGETIQVGDEFLQDDDWSWRPLTESGGLAIGMPFTQGMLPCRRPKAPTAAQQEADQS